MAFISEAKFESQLCRQVQGNDAISFNALPINIIFKIIHRRQLHVHDEGDMKYILTLSDKDKNTYNVWAPGRLCRELIELADDTDIFLRYNGKVNSKANPGHWYYDYDLIKV